MATITATNTAQVGAVAVTRTTLNGSSDTFTFNAAKSPILILENDSGGAISPVIDGDGGTTVTVAGVGAVDVTGGFAVGSIADGAAVVIHLNTVREFLRGTIAITSGSGLVATLLEQ